MIKKMKETALAIPEQFRVFINERGTVTANGYSLFDAISSEYQQSNEPSEKLIADHLAASSPANILTLLESHSRLEDELRYFVDRCEDPSHPDGPIKSKTTLARFKKALAEVQSLQLP